MVKLTELFVSTHSTIMHHPKYVEQQLLIDVESCHQLEGKIHLTKPVFCVSPLAIVFIIFFLSQILNLNEWWAFTASENALASSHYWKNKFLSLQKKQWSFQYLDLEATCSGHSIIYCNFIHNFWSFEFLNLAVDQLKERRNKLRKRLNNGPHEILQKYLKKSKGRFIWQIFWSSVLFHLIACLFPTYKLFCFAVLALKLHPGKSDYFPIKHAVRSALNKIKCHCFSQL